MHSLHPMVLSRTEAERSDGVRNLKELFVSSSEFCVGHHPFRESFPLYSIMSDCEGLPMGEYCYQCQDILDLSCFWLGLTLTTHPANMFSYSA